MKAVSVENYASIYDAVKLKFQKVPGNFPANFKLMFEEEGLDEFVDLDSPIELDKRRSNKLLIVEVPRAVVSEEEYTDDESDDESIDSM